MKYFSENCHENDQGKRSLIKFSKPKVICGYNETVACWPRGQCQKFLPAAADSYKKRDV